MEMNVDKVCIVRMMTNTDNVESSLFVLFNIRNLVHVQFLLQVAHLQSCSLVLLVELCPMKCVLQVVRHTEHIA